MTSCNAAVQQAALRVLPIRLSVHLSSSSLENKKKRRKIKIGRGLNVPQGMNKWSANFQLQRSKVKVTGC